MFNLALFPRKQSGKCSTYPHLQLGASFLKVWLQEPTDFHNGAETIHGLALVGGVIKKGVSAKDKKK